MGVRYGGAKRGKYRFECPNASSGEKKYGNVRCRNQSAAYASNSIWAFIPIHVDPPISSFPFFLLLLSQAVTVIFIHHLAKLLQNESLCSL